MSRVAFNYTHYEGNTFLVIRVKQLTLLGTYSITFIKMYSRRDLYGMNKHSSFMCI